MRKDIAFAVCIEWKEYEEDTKFVTTDLNNIKDYIERWHGNDNDQYNIKSIIIDTLEFYDPKDWQK